MCVWLSGYGTVRPDFRGKERDEGFWQMFYISTSINLFYYLSCLCLHDCVMEFITLVKFGTGVTMGFSIICVRCFLTVNKVAKKNRQVSSSEPKVFFCITNAVYHLFQVIFFICHIV